MNDKLHGAETFLRRYYFLRWPTNITNFMEPESSLPLSHEPITGLYREPDDTILHPPIRFLYHLIFPPSRARSFKLSRCFRFSPHSCVGISFLSHASYLSCSTHPPAGTIFKWRKKQRRGRIKIIITQSCQYFSDQRGKSSGFRTMLGIVTEYFQLSVRSNHLC